MGLTVHESIPPPPGPPTGKPKQYNNARHPALTPTGITGLLTHPHPRPTLIALYNHTLSVLSHSHRENIPRPENVRVINGEVRLDETEMVLEPQMTGEQVEEIEQKIGGGLLEEVVEEGWAELKCAEAMLEDKPWEPLEVVADEGQWVAFERPAAQA